MMSYNIKLRDGFSKLGVVKIDGESFQTPGVIPFEKLKNLNSRVSLKLKIIDERRFEVLRVKSEIFIFNTPLDNPFDFVSLLKDYLLNNKEFRVFYAPAMATAYNIPILSYFGMDIFDTALAELAAELGIFMTESGNINASKIKENFCHCSICEKEGEEVLKNRELLKEHNINLMMSRAKLTRELIRRGELRNFIESEVKHSTFYTAALRLFDGCWDKEHPFQRFKKSKAIFCSQESFSRSEVLYFLKRVEEVYEPKTKVALVLPCSAKKPYLLSKTHSKIRQKLKGINKSVNEIIISSPLVTPREFELCYPACNYDVAVTGSWGEDEVEFVSKKLVSLLKNFEIVGGYVSGGYRKVFERACKMAGIDGIILDDLEEVKKFVEKMGEKHFDLYLEMFKAVSNYQFGCDILSWIDSRKNKVKVKGKYPEIELFCGKNRVARFDVSRGMIDIYIPDFFKKTEYKVEIEDFKPKGTIFAAGVKKADFSIKPGDLVGFFGENWKGVGIARISGREMEDLNEGYAIDVKRVEKNLS